MVAAAPLAPGLSAELLSDPVLQRGAQHPPGPAHRDFFGIIVQQEATRMDDIERPSSGLL